MNELIQDNQIDIIGIQESKREKMSQRFIKSCLLYGYEGIILPAVGTAGGIFVGYNSSIVQVLGHCLSRFSISLIVKYELDNFQFGITFVYGPTKIALKNHS